MRTIHRNHCRGFALTDLLVVFIAVALLMGIAVPARQMALEMRNRIKCSSNLRQIGQCLALYANENGHIYPRTGYSMDNAAKPDLTNLGVDCSDPFLDNNYPFDPKGVGANNITSVLFLLARTENLQLIVFTCPSADAKAMDIKAEGVRGHSNFTEVPGKDKSGNLSYSIANPYPGKDAVGDGFKWNDTIASDYAMAADLNPGKSGGQDPAALSADASAKQMRTGNSLNHTTVGQNVLFADGHVDFVFHPMWGVNHDCIYTVGGVRRNGVCAPTSVTLVGPPSSRDDSVLLPVQALESPAATPPSTPPAK